MGRVLRRRWLPVLVASLLLAGVFAPIAIFGQASASSQQSQLSAFMGAAESSRSYAHGIVDTAVSDGLSVAPAQSQLSQGDSLLATAQADAQAGTNLAAGLQDVQAAMSDYASASASASLALSDAGFTSTVSYDVALSAVAEVNATLDVAASVAAQVCGGAGATASEAQGYSQACSQVGANVTAARADLSQAATLLVQSSGHVATSAQIARAQALVVQARGDVQACQSLLLTISSYGYSQRAQAYVSPLYASANATIKAEGSLVAQLAAYQTAWAAYVQSQGSAASNINSSASTLNGEIANVGVSGVASALTSAQSADSKTTSEMVALLNIGAIAALPGVTADVRACSSAAQTYGSSLTAAQSWSSTYAQTSLSAFDAYASSGSSYSASVASDGSAFLTACNSVIADLSSLLTVPGVQVIYDALVGLQLSTTVSDGSTALSQELGAMQAVEAGIAALNSTVSTYGSAVLASSALLTSADSVSSSGGAYLNATVAASLSEVYTSAENADLGAQAFVAAAQACLQTSIGTYSTAYSSLTFSQGPLGTRTQASSSAVATAATYLNGDAAIRGTEAASGRAYLSQALSYFSTQNVASGTAALSQASAEFQLASGA